MVHIMHGNECTREHADNSAIEMEYCENRTKK